MMFVALQLRDAAKKDANVNALVNLDYFADGAASRGRRAPGDQAIFFRVLIRRLSPYC
jgi:hypothetical protein